jgi:hypothetical protein
MPAAARNYRHLIRSTMMEQLSIPGSLDLPQMIAALGARLADGDLHRWLQRADIFRLPEPVYQIMYSVTQMTSDEAWRKAKLQRILRDWLEDRHPDRDLGALADFSTKEAQAIHPQLGWGLYLYLPRKRPAHNRGIPEEGIDRWRRQTDAWGNDRSLPAPQKSRDPDRFRRMYPRRPDEATPPPSEQ